MASAEYQLIGVSPPSLSCATTGETSWQARRTVTTVLLLLSCTCLALVLLGKARVQQQQTQRRRRHASTRKEPSAGVSPPPPGVGLLPKVPFLQNLRATLLNRFPHRAVTDLIRSYGSLFQLKVGKNDFVVLNDIETVLAVMRKFPAAMSGKPTSITSSMLGAGAHKDEGKRWKKRRSVAMSSVRSFFRESGDIIYNVIEDEIDHLLDTLRAKSAHPGQSFAVENDLTYFVARAMFRLIYGEGREPDQQTAEQLSKIAHGVADYSTNAGPFSKLDFFPWMKFVYRQSYLKYKMVSKLFCQVCRVFKDKRVSGDNSHFYMSDLMAFFVRAARDIPTDVKESLSLGDDLLFSGLEDLLRAGCESPALLLQWLILCLVKYPRVQQQMAEEIRDQLGAERAQSTYADIESLPYSTAVFYETIRYTSLVPFLKRKTLDDVQIHGRAIPRGTAILINNHAINHDPAKWGDAAAFRPERFLTPEGAFDKTKLEIFLPFGVGKRRCIGEEIGKGFPFVAITSLVKNFKFVQPVDREPTLEPDFGITMTPRKYKVIIEDRNS